MHNHLPPPVDTTANWRSRAACPETDPEEFFPPNYDKRTVALAKMICAGCVVKEQCLTEALEKNETDGIWGGTTPHERRWLASRRPGRLLRTSPQSRS